MAVKLRRRNREEEAEVEATKRIEVTLAAPGHLAVAAVALLERLHRVPDLPKAQGLVAEAADGGIQEGKPRGRLPEAVLLGDPQASPLPTEDRYVEITCRESVNEHKKTASFGITTLSVL